ncbi:RNA polymerase II C-terminal domain phosphatase-like 2 [Durio zibethinus]|uniref:RNA polymerase II C-terminal domain phosphatase-like 2 n=1 Tax=Durio zibethinus TaxID=66656 RepID=A0A6P6A810_DURZI|nr:RNA polymerase II C-terminal domain phosphatase-like 2 [Durio zibethinus]
MPFCSNPLRSKKCCMQFQREFDENVLPKLHEDFYEDEVANLPLTPDVSSYLMSEDSGFAPNGNSGVSISEGMNGIEVEQTTNQSIRFG